MYSVGWLARVRTLTTTEASGVRAEKLFAIRDWRLRISPLLI